MPARTRYLLPLLALPGCAANLTTLQGPRTLAPGQVMVDGEAGVGVPVGTLSRAVDAGVALSAAAANTQTSDEALDTDTLREAFAAGAGLALSPPGTVWGASLRVGVVKDVDLGLRFSSTDLRLDGKWMFSGDGEITPANAVELGLMKRRFRGPLLDVYDQIQSVAEVIPGFDLEDPTRWDIEALYLRGKRNLPWLESALTARYRFGWYHVPTVLSIPVAGEEVVQYADLDGTTHLLGLTGGVAVGKDPIWLHLELNTAYSFARTEVLGAPVDFGGLIVFPAASLSIQSRPPKRLR